MGKRDDLIAQYADDLKNKCGMTPDMDLLTKVTIGCGPAIYNADASTVAGSQASELETVKENFLIKKLGLKEMSTSPWTCFKSSCLHSFKQASSAGVMNLSYISAIR